MSLQCNKRLVRTALRAAEQAMRCASLTRALERITLALGAIVICSTASAGSPWRELDGSFVVGGPAIGDVPPEVRTAGTHIRFGIFGDAAKEVWSMIDAPATFDACGEDHLTKRSGSIECGYYESNDRYACYFGVGIASNEIVRGATC